MRSNPNASVLHATSNSFEFTIFHSSDLCGMHHAACSSFKTLKGHCPNEVEYELRKQEVSLLSLFFERLF